MRESSIQAGAVLSAVLAQGCLGLASIVSTSGESGASKLAGFVRLDYFAAHSYKALSLCAGK